MTMPKCIKCKRNYQHHQAWDNNCPIGRKHRTLGFTQFHNDSFYTAPTKLQSKIVIKNSSESFVADALKLFVADAFKLAEFYANWRHDIYVGPAAEILADQGQKAVDFLKRFLYNNEQKMCQYRFETI